MTDKTFTDEEIVKALEVESVPSEMNCVYGEYREACGIYCTKKKQNAEYCHECKAHEMDYRGRRAKATLALINRQKAELAGNRATMGMCADVIARQDKQIAEMEREIARLKGETFYSPEDISNMTPKQIRENYSAIMDSMKKWS